MSPLAGHRATGIIGLVLLVVLLSVAACGSEGPSSVDSGSGSTPGAAPTRADLDGRTFLSQSVTESGTPRASVQGRPISMTFDGQVLRANAGCNTTGGDYALDGDRLEMSDLSSTTMACEDAGLMNQDDWFGSLLQSGPTLVLAGDQLTMTSNGTVIVFLDREAADPDRPLVGTDWTLQSIIGGQAVSSVPAGVTATLSVPTSDTITWTACNTASGPIEELTATTMRIGQMSSTLKACSAAETSVAGSIAAVLSGTVTYEIEGPVLHLHNGSNGLDFRAA